MIAPTYKCVISVTNACIKMSASSPIKLNKRQTYSDSYAKLSVSSQNLRRCTRISMTSYVLQQSYIPQQVIPMVIDVERSWHLHRNVPPFVRLHVPEVCDEIFPDRSTYQTSVKCIQ